ncbi:unannotated protein [freshwater metagenome]|uniref:Unannotated protein n=1 Tax=freshwater metagenome TaxID=449393 RepID=A0A6J6KY82_9ZZZZ
MRLSSGNYVIVWLVLLQHHPHCFHVVAGIAPVALCVGVAEHKLFFNTKLDACCSVGDFASDKFEATTRAFVIEQNSGRSVKPVALAIVHGDVVTKHLRNAVRRTRVEGGEFGLGHFAYLAKHFG